VLGGGGGSAWFCVKRSWLRAAQGIYSVKAPESLTNINKRYGCSEACYVLQHIFICDINICIKHSQVLVEVQEN
jgi:hypothetical protein